MSIKRKRVTSALRTLFIKKNPIAFAMKDSPLMLVSDIISSFKKQNGNGVITTVFTDEKLYRKRMAQRYYKGCMDQYRSTFNPTRLPAINHAITAMKINAEGHVEGTVVAKKCAGCASCKQTPKRFDRLIETKLPEGKLLV